MILLRLYFLASIHKAQYYSIKGKPYNGDKDVYYRFWNMPWKPQKNQKKYRKPRKTTYPKRSRGTTYKIRFVFSGPSGMDIIKSAASITKKALNIMPDYIDNILNLGFAEEDLKIEIAGHSRGGMIAQNVFEELAEMYPGVIFSIAKYDEYGGPFNRLIKKNDAHDLRTKVIGGNSLVVISLRPAVPFRSIAKNKNPKTLIFTTCNHSSCMAVGKAFLKLYKGSARYGVFIHISTFRYRGNNRKKTFSKQIHKLITENAYVELTKENALKLLQKLAKAIGCKPKVYNSNDINEVVKGIVSKKFSIFHAVSRRRAKAFIDALIKLGILDAEKWKHCAYCSEEYQLLV